MNAPPPDDLKEFHIELPGNGLAHIVFDAPGRSMNVFSEDAIVEIARIARWLEDADVRGALIRSGKATGFCAGANLPEIWAAYDMIMATTPPRRFRAAYDHFFRLSLALRALETCGKPVASAIAGLALGGGGELALASHYRVLTDDRRAAIGLPELLVGLLPGAGGTQRLPRLIGIERAMAIAAGPAAAWSRRDRQTDASSEGMQFRPELIPAGLRLAANKDVGMVLRLFIQYAIGNVHVASKPAGCEVLRQLLRTVSQGDYCFGSG